MAKDIRGRLFKHNEDIEIELKVGKTFTLVYEYKGVLKDYAI